MPALTAPQLALLRSQPQTSEWFIHPIVPPTVFAAQINDAAITVGARTITFDNVTTGAFTDVVAGMTLWVGTAPNTYNVARIRVRSATSAHLIVAENSDVSWADNYYLTVKREWLCWSIRPFINSSGTVFKDYDIAYTDQTLKWPPVAMMGDPVCKPWAGNPTSVYFDGSESYATSPGATITGYAWNFGDGTTSTAAIPGNHNYTSAGDRWASLTVTDSNGKTCVTYRPVSLPDPATLYTAKFEEQSLDAAIDGGWTGQCSVFAPAATVTEFPERAPVFLIAVNTYGGTAGAVGYPLGRENVVLFGYIQDDSVEETPETSSIQFTMESVDKVAARAAAITTFVGDATTPANWDEGLDLNIFRSFVYLLAFQSTLFQIADVRLFNDTTLIKIARFPEDNLWNMFAQFARGARLMRVGVTRTGRVIVGRDPNLLPIASRSTVTTVCQLRDGDWADTVTIPEHPYPATSFLCLSGISYDGDPAHDPTPLFGMSPGHPPKEYGTSREIHDLALVNQLEAEILAGLAVGQDNNAFGEVNIPLWANWIGAFDPAYQEYVTAPIGGFVTNRGGMLDAASLIVRKVSIGFDWSAGAMRSTLSCEVYSYPDIGMIGDCYTTDAPAPPPQNIPPVIPPPAPVPTNGANLLAGVWTLFAGQAVYKLTVVASGGGTATSKPAWDTGLGTTQNGLRLAPGPNRMVNIISELAGDAHLPHSTDDGATWRDYDTGIVGSTGILANRYQLATDPANRNRVFAVNQPLDPSSMPASAKDNLALQFQAIVAGGYSDWAASKAAYSDWFTDFAPIYMWISTNGGATYTAVLLDYLGQLVPTRFMFNGQTYGAGSLIKHMQAGNVDSGHPLSDWQAFMCSSMTEAYAIANGYSVGGDYNYDGLTPPWLAELVEVSTSGGTHETTWDGFFVCNILPFSVSGNYLFYPPTGAAYVLAPLYNGSAAYVIVWAQGYANTAQDLSDPTAIERAVIPLQSWYSGLTPAAFSVDPYVVFIYKVTTAGVKVRRTVSVGVTGPYFGAADPTNPDHLFFVPQGSPVPVYRYTWSTNTLTTVNASVSPGGGFTQQLLVTTLGTILIACSDGTFLRSVNGGTTFSTVNPGFSASGLAMDEYIGTGSTLQRVLVATNDGTGKYIYSLDDGVTWRQTADITVHDTALSNRAR